MIELSNVSKIYGSGDSAVHALQNVNLTIPKGTIHGVIGLSGAGKSTLLHVLGMHDSDWTGEFEFFGYPVHAMKPKERAKLINDRMTALVISPLFCAKSHTRRIVRAKTAKSGFMRREYHPRERKEITKGNVSRFIVNRLAFLDPRAWCCSHIAFSSGAIECSALR